MAKKVRRINKNPTWEETLADLHAGAERGNTPPARLFYGLSGITAEQTAQLKPHWLGLDVAYRRAIMNIVADTSESDFEMDYTEFGRMTLTDDDEQVRVRAIDALWMDETPGLMRALMGMAKTDPSDRVRASAALALGRFVLLGEYGNISADEQDALTTLLLSMLRDPSLDVDVRRRSLEAVANGMHPDVPGEIRRAYDSDDHAWRVSAIFAMGRTSDEQWSRIVLEELENDNDEIRYEAARAAGEIGMDSAVPRLARLLIEDDREIQEIAIWALGEIGGMEARRVLENMLRVVEESDDVDEELVESIEDALANADYMSSGLFAMLDDDDD